MQAAAGRLREKRARLAILAAIASLAMLLALAIGGRPSASAAPTATASKSVTVKIKDFSYRPHTLNVAKGTTVVWTNKDSVKHTATRRGSFTTGKIKPGHSAAVRFTAKGTYRYICTLHEGMSGKVVVG
jgi:plastocyanin